MAGRRRWIWAIACAALWASTGCQTAPPPATTVPPHKDVTLRAEVVTPRWVVNVQGDFRDMHFDDIEMHPTSSIGCVRSVVRNDLRYEMRYDRGTGSSGDTQLWLVGGTIEFTVDPKNQWCWNTDLWTEAPYALEGSAVLTDRPAVATTTTTCPPPPPMPPGGWPSAGETPALCSETLAPRSYRFHAIVYQPYVRFVK